MNIMKSMEILEPDLKMKIFGPTIKYSMEAIDNPSAFRTVGRYSKMMSEGLIFRKSMYIQETSLTAKLPEPVAIKTKFTVMEQPARNLIDPTMPSINDLDYADQEIALGKDPNEAFKIRELSFGKKLRESVETQPYIREIPKFNDKQLRGLLERL